MAKVNYSQHTANLRAAAGSQFSAILERAMETNLQSRVIELERRLEGAKPNGDFAGSVTGYWKRLNARGVGLVEHRGKVYKTRPIGFMSLPKGTEVELTFAQGVYYSKF